MAEQVVSRTGAASAADTGRLDYRAEVISNPHELPGDRALRLSMQIADLACRAVGGEAEDEPGRAAIRRGWEAYCTEPGGRANDYDRLVVVWHEDELVGFSGYIVKTIEPDITVQWYKAAGTDPAHQRRGAFQAARDAIQDVDWLTSYGTAQTWWVMRTPNPLVYDIARRWWAKFPDWYTRFYPQINEHGSIEPLTDEARDACAHVASEMWPECEYDADRLVLRDFLGEYGRDIWRVPRAISPMPGTQVWFTENLRPGNRDALLNLCRFRV
jgi:hypothetical protein